jgi:hypothetical protein
MAGRSSMTGDCHIPICGGVGGGNPLRYPTRDILANFIETALTFRGDIRFVFIIQIRKGRYTFSVSLSIWFSGY